MHPFSFSTSYPSIRQPVFARNVVATSQPLAAQAGLRMLQAGGNAVDAAIATAAALTIVEPVSNGLGSDAFCMIWDGRQLHGLNASGGAPDAWTPEYFEHKYGAGRRPPKRGWDSVTVPGAVAGWAALSECFGRLPFADLMQPAIGYARDGFAVSVIAQKRWAGSIAELDAQPGFAAAFMPGGCAPQAGQTWRFPAAARALQAIGASRGEAFYRGEIAEALVRHAAANGGAMSRADLESYRPDWVEPISRAFQGHVVHELPPNGQGVAALMALSILEHLGIGRFAPDSPIAQHLQIEAMKLAFADVYRYVGSEQTMQVRTSDLIDDSYLRKRAALIDERRAQDFGPGNPAQGGTVYLATGDADGMMVSFIQSNFMGFGSGVVEPEWGISLQNRGHAFSLQPGPNIVAPGKRPFHTIIPGFVTNGGRAAMAFGVMGANMQPQGHVQTLARILAWGQNPQAACDAPRWRIVDGLNVEVEATMSPELVQGLAGLGHRIKIVADSYQDFGSGQFIWNLGDPGARGYIAASDWRRDGQAAGY